MELHPGPQKHRFAAVEVAESDPVRRALHENEDWYQDLAEHSHDLLCIHDLEGRLLSVSPTPARLLGYTAEEILQIPMRELIAPEFRNQFDAYLTEIARAGEARGVMELLTRAGKRRSWEYHNTPRRGLDAPILRVLPHYIPAHTYAATSARD